MRLKGIMAVIGAALAAFVAFFKVGQRSGRKDAEKRAVEAVAKKDGKGRDAVAKEQAETSGLSADDIVERMRRRDGDWGGL